MSIKINLSSEQKLNRIYSLERFCDVCCYKNDCDKLGTPCSYQEMESLIDYTKIDEVHKILFGF